MISPGQWRHRRVLLGLVLGLPLITGCSTAPAAGSNASGVTAGGSTAPSTVTSVGARTSPTIASSAAEHTAPTASTGAGPTPPASTSPTPTSSASAGSSPPGRGTPASLPANAIKVRLADVPATITAGKVVSFTAILVNRSRVPAHDVAPLIQIGGGPCNCAIGSLLRYDSRSHRWNAAPLITGDGDPDFLSAATGGVSVPPGAGVAIRYRLTLSTVNPAKSLTAALYAVQLPDARQLAMATVPAQVVQS
jgi:hypothetical protein